MRKRLWTAAASEARRRFPMREQFPDASAHPTPSQSGVALRLPPQSIQVLLGHRSEDGKTLTVRVVNTGKVALPARISLDGFVPRKRAAHTTILMGDWDAINTPEQPGRIRPSQSDWRHEFKDGAISRTFAPYSFTILRFR